MGRLLYIATDTQILVFRYMIYFKNLQTNEVIEFENENQIGSYFYNTSLFTELTNQEDIDNYLFKKKKDELIAYCNQQRVNRKNLFKIVYNNQEYIAKDIDDSINTINELIEQEPRFPFPRSLRNNADSSIVFIFQTKEQAEYIKNELLYAKKPNYDVNYFSNTELINACTTLEELENLQLIFVDLVINL